MNFTVQQARLVFSQNSARPLKHIQLIHLSSSHARMLKQASVFTLQVELCLANTATSSPCSAHAWGSRTSSTLDSAQVLVTAADESSI